jgi:SAM-dependent methyltransferase
MPWVKLPGRAALVVALTGLVALACTAAGDDRDEKRAPDINYIPTPQKVVDRMLEVARVTKKDVVYDLGCGDGRIVCTAAKKYRCKAVGFDIDSERIKECEANKAKLDRDIQKLVTFKRQDIFKLDLREATVVTLYLWPALNVKLIPQLKKLPRGSRIVSHSFDMKGVRPDKGYPIDAADEGGAYHKIYLWTTPLRLEK